MSQLDEIKNKIAEKLYKLSFFDAADLDDINIITTSSNGGETLHEINLASGTYDGRNIEGKDTDGRNIHLPAEYIVNIR